MIPAPAQYLLRFDDLCPSFAFLLRALHLRNTLPFSLPPDPAGAFRLKWRSGV